MTGPCKVGISSFRSFSQEPSTVAKSRVSEFSSGAGEKDPSGVKDTENAAEGRELRRTREIDTSDFSSSAWPELNGNKKKGSRI